MDKYEVLKRYFGYDSFRNGQESLVDAILSGRDGLGIMPTGGGKSLCYQIPALIMDGITFVISPLISLMQDQVMQLKDAGIAAAYINSSLTPRQLELVYDNLQRKKYKIVYIAPERLCVDEFLYLSKGLDISMVAVDEAHCISQWGQDFRPSYLKITEFLQSLPKRPVVAAFTATATDNVREDIESLLGLVSPFKVVTSFDRPNLSFDVMRPKNRIKALTRLVAERSGKSGIIYCATRKNVERVCDVLCDAGFSATRYHAGLGDDERQRNQEDFLYDRKPVMVATNAFGMGINKSNVNYVIHYNMPKSLEEYYQEAGRAGRDGESAECILLYGEGDVITAKRLIGGKEEITGVLPDTELRELHPKEMHRLDSMTDYCRATVCYRGKILDYFGEAHAASCGNCGNCVGEYELQNVTVEAQKILSCIERIHRKLNIYLGKTMIIGALRGKRFAKLLEYGLDKISTYGIMSDEPHETVESIFDSLVSNGYIVINSEYKTAEPGEKAAEVLFENENVFIKLKKKKAAELIPKKEPKKKKRVTESRELQADGDLYESLRELRLALAAKENMPAYIVFSNATLADMAHKRPKSMEEFMAVSGVGETKAEKYGEAFLEVIARYSSEKKDGREDAIPNVPTTRVTDDVVNALFDEAARRVTYLSDSVDSGMPWKMTALMTESGGIYSAENKGDILKLGNSESELIKELTEKEDTVVVCMLTLWRDGAVRSASPELYKQICMLNSRNANTAVVVANSPKTVYLGVYDPSRYRMQALKDLLN